MITKDFVVKIKKDETKLNGMPYVYQGDRGIVFEMTLDNWKYFFSQATGIEEDQLVDCRARILMFNPNEEQIKLADAPIKNNEVNFIINQNLTEIAGNYTVYIQIFEPDGATVTCPPFIFTVKELKSFEKVLPSDRGTIKIQDQYVLSYDSTEECGAKFISELPKVTAETDENYLIIQVDGITNIISVADFLKDTKAELKKYTDDKDTRMKSYVDTNFQRIDENVNSKEAELKQYSDNNLQTAKKYTDDELSAKSTTINTRIDNVIADMNKADTTLDKKIDTKETELKQYSDTNLQAGKDYTDTKSAENSKVDQKYADEKREEAKSYADEKLIESQGYTDGKLTEAKEYTDIKTQEAKEYSDTNIKDLVGAAPETLDTIYELADAYKNNKNVIDTLVDGKANKVHTHVSTDIIEDATHRFITDDERESWNSKAKEKHTHTKSEITDLFIVENDFTSNSTENAISVSKAKETDDKVNTLRNEYNATKDVVDNKLDELSISTENELVANANGIEKYRLPLPKGFDGKYTSLTDIPKEFVPLKHTHKVADIEDMFIVEDSLTSTSTANALSAAKGKELQDQLNKLDTSGNHTHDNKNELDLIKIGDVAKWNKITTKYDDFEIVGEEIIFKIDGVEVKRGTLPHGFSGVYTDLTDIPTEFNPSKHTHVKADITDLSIIDNLTTTDADNPLSANQGKLIKDELDTINRKIDSIHTHSNKTELDKITDGKVAKWDAKETTIGSQEKASQAETNAKGYADTKLVEAKGYTDTKVVEVKGYTDTKISDLVGAAPETLDTIQEISQALKGDANIVDTLTSQISGKANSVHTHKISEITDLFKVENDFTSNSTTNALSVAQGKSMNDKILGIENTIKDKANSVHTHDATDITEDATHRFVTDDEKSKWNNSTDISDETVSKTSTWSSDKISNIIGANVNLIDTKVDKILESI